MIKSIDAKKFLIVCFLIFVATFSKFVCAEKVSEQEFYTAAVDSLEDSRDTIIAFSGATIATSVAISFLPGDTATPLANTLAEMNKFFVFLLAVIFVEKILLIEGTKVSLAMIIPLACFIYLIGMLIKKEWIVNIASKIAILGISLVVIIPITINLTNFVCSDYLSYVDETIEETKNGSDTINGIATEEEGEKGFFDQISDALGNVIKGASDLLEYFNYLIKKCVNAIAIMMVSTFAMPLLIFIIFKWLLGELFHITVPSPNFKNGNMGDSSKKEDIDFSFLSKGKEKLQGLIPKVPDKEDVE